MAKIVGRYAKCTEGQSLFSYGAKKEKESCRKKTRPVYVDLCVAGLIRYVST